MGTPADAMITPTVTYALVAPTVQALARKYAHGDDTLAQDLAQEGAIEALAALEAFEARYGASAKTYVAMRVERRLIKLGRIRHRAGRLGGASLDAAVTEGEDGAERTRYDLLGTPATQLDYAEARQLVGAMGPLERAQLEGRLEEDVSTQAKQGQHSQARLGGGKRGAPKGTRGGSVRDLAARLGISKSAAGRMLLAQGVGA